MIGSLLSFLGGTAFRWLLGEVFGYLKEKREHESEMERMRLQHEQDKDKHAWQQEAIANAAAQGIQLVRVQAEAAGEAASATAFIETIKGINTAMERKDWIGAWNAIIRPFLATVAILLLVGNALWPAHVSLSALLMDLICAVLGVFVGERIRAKGK